jgi:hypothetical protein
MKDTFEAEGLEFEASFRCFMGWRGLDRQMQYLLTTCVYQCLLFKPFSLTTLESAYHGKKYDNSSCLERGASKVPSKYACF